MIHNLSTRSHYLSVFLLSKRSRLVPTLLPLKSINLFGTSKRASFRLPLAGLGLPGPPIGPPGGNNSDNFHIFKLIGGITGLSAGTAYIGKQGVKSVSHVLSKKATNKMKRSEFMIKRQDNLLKSLNEKKISPEEYVDRGIKMGLEPDDAVKDVSYAVKAWKMQRKFDEEDAKYEDSHIKYALKNDGAEFDPLEFVRKDVLQVKSSGSPDSGQNDQGENLGRNNPPFASMNFSSIGMRNKRNVHEKNREKGEILANELDESENKLNSSLESENKLDSSFKNDVNSSSSSKGNLPSTKKISPDSGYIIGINVPSRKEDPEYYRLLPPNFISSSEYMDRKNRSAFISETIESGILLIILLGSVMLINRIVNGYWIAPAPNERDKKISKLLSDAWQRKNAFSISREVDGEGVEDIVEESGISLRTKEPEGADIKASENSSVDTIVSTDLIIVTPGVVVTPEELSQEDKSQAQVESLMEDNVMTTKEDTGVKVNMDFKEDLSVYTPKEEGTLEDLSVYTPTEEGNPEVNDKNESNQLSLLKRVNKYFTNWLA